MALSMQCFSRGYVSLFFFPELNGIPFLLYGPTLDFNLKLGTVLVELF